MPTLVGQISPERSTQYARLASELAPHELRLSPLGARIGEIRRLQAAGLEYLRFDLPAAPDATELEELGRLALTCAYFEWFDRLGEHDGPFLHPLETGFRPALPSDILSARRYKGKTNELFTLFLCNLARASSACARQPWKGIRVLDPLAGGGTTLFAALYLGASSAGIEKDAVDAESTATFLRGYLQEQRIHQTLREERLRKVGHRWNFTIGRGDAQRCLIARGETAQARELVSGFKPHLIVTDLPYGIQHEGALVDLLGEALPVWAGLLQPGGALVFSWDATRLPRPEMIAAVESACPLVVRDEPPYNQLAHRVDRVIKQRDVIVACPTG